MLTEYVGFDLETTGVDPEGDAIIQIGAVLVAGGRPVARWGALVNPGRPVPVAVQRLTGITDEALAGQPALEEVLPAFLQFAGQRPLVAHNAPFDRSFLDAACRRCLGTPWTGTMYDTLELARLALPGPTGHRLEEVAARLGVPVVRSHDALADAEAAALVFARLLDVLRSYPAAALRRAAAFLGAADPLLAALAGWAALAGPPPVAPDVAAGARGDDGEGSRPGDASRAPRLDRWPDPEEIAAWLERGGAVAASLPGYEPRPGQLRMLRAVAATLAEGGALIVEAGTGTGKSLAYLLPALALAAATGQRVVVSTHTLQLQEQIWRKDLPLLAGALPLPVRAALVKGRSNYVCLWKWEELQPEQVGHPQDARLYARLALWLGRSETGDRSELSLRREEEAAWAAVAVDEACAGDRCRHGERCPYLRARQQAAQASLLIVNHALLLADATTDNRVLPPYRHLICDEAHHLPEVASQQFAVRLSEAELLRLLDGLHRPGARGAPGLLDRLGRHPEGEVAAARAAVGPAREAVGELFAALRAVAGRDLQAGEGGAWRLTVLARRPGWPAVVAAAENLSGRLRALAAALAPVVEAAAARPEALAALRARLQQVVGAAAVVEEVLHAARQDDGERVAWFEVDEGTGAGCVVDTPLEPGPELAERLFLPLHAVVLTSATLSIDGSFEYFVRQVGLDEARTLAIDPAFAYREQALLCLPTDVPDPAGDEESYLEQACAFLGRLGPALGGRTLVLFTSHRALREAYRRLAEPLARADITLLGQGIDGGQARLLEAFRRQPRAMLLGAASFWEGIDLPGDLLQCVVLMRLPFRPPGHPLTEARLEAIASRGGDAFRHLTLPEAVLRFKQGFGRLVRRSTDRGAVVVLDPRLLSRHASYGHAFLASLPGPRLFTGTLDEVLEAVARWVLRGVVPPAGALELVGNG